MQRSLRVPFIFCPYRRYDEDFSSGKNNINGVACEISSLRPDQHINVERTTDADIYPITESAFLELL